MKMKYVIFYLAFASLFLISCNNRKQLILNQTQKVLLVGNSILYKNDVASLLVELSSKNGKKLSVDMFAEPGATLANLWTTIDLVTSTEKYSHVFVQERGGDILCILDEPTLTSECSALVAAHQHFLAYAQTNRSRFYIVGTYQLNSTAGIYLNQAELKLSRELNANQISIQPCWSNLLTQGYQSKIYDNDGAHPSRYGSLIYAISIYEAIYNEPPAFIPSDYDIDSSANHGMSTHSKKLLSSQGTTQLDQKLSKEILEKCFTKL